MPLITHTDRLFFESTIGGPHDETTVNNLHFHPGAGHYHGVLFSQLKYSIRLHLIIKAIELRYGITFSTDFFSDANSIWHNLYMWMHRKKGDVIPGEQAGTFTKLVTGFTVDLDGFNLDCINSSTVKFNTSSVRRSSDFELKLTRVGAAPYSVSILRNGVSVYNENNITSAVRTIDLNDIRLGFAEYQILLTYATAITFTEIEWYFEQDDDDDIYATSFEATADFEFIITQQLPEIKVIDFLTGIFRMFNLTAFVEDEIIVVKTLDSFYASADVYDITKFVDVNKSSSDVALPYKQIDFGFEDYKTFLAAQFNQLNGQQFGELKFKTDDTSNFVGGIYKVTLPFQKILYERLNDLFNNNQTSIQYGFFVDDNRQSYIGKPLIHYVHRQTAATGETPISFRTNDVNHIEVENYYIPLNQNGLTSVQSLHFGTEVNEFRIREAFNTNEESLFKNFYKNYIEGIFNEKRRIIKVTAYLPLSILLNYNLSDTFVIGSIAYKINSITTNLENGKSELELLNEI